MNKMELNMDFIENPAKYLSYEKMVKAAIKDFRPEKTVTGLYGFAVQAYPSFIKGQAMVFKIDGACIHKKLSDVYVLVSPIILEGYKKTAIEFLNDWNRQH